MNQAVLSALAATKITCAELKLMGRSGCFQDAKRCHGSPEEGQSAATGVNVLVTAGAKAEKVATLIVASAEPGGRSSALEVPHADADTQELGSY